MRIAASRSGPCTRSTTNAELFDLLVQQRRDKGCSGEIDAQNLLKKQGFATDVLDIIARVGTTAICAFETFERRLESTFSGHCKSRLDI